MKLLADGETLPICRLGLRVVGIDVVYGSVVSERLVRTRWGVRLRHLRLESVGPDGTLVGPVPSLSASETGSGGTERLALFWCKPRRTRCRRAGTAAVRLRHTDGVNVIAYRVNR